MEQVRVNLTLERETWERFGQLVPNRQKSRAVNELLKREVLKKIRESEERALRLAFAEAATDKARETAINDWNTLDTEGWS
mgnify:FL=1|jgi:hypothetical protein